MVYHGIHHNLKYKVFSKVFELLRFYLMSSNFDHEFLGCKIRQTNFVTNDQGRATGECFVVLESSEDADNAKHFHQNMLGSRM